MRKKNAFSSSLDRNEVSDPAPSKSLLYVELHHNTMLHYLLSYFFSSFQIQFNANSSGVNYFLKVELTVMLSMRIFNETYFIFNLSKYFTFKSDL